MDGVFMFLFIVGFIAFLVGAVLLLINVFKKKGKKMPLLVTSTGLFFFILSGSFLTTDEPNLLELEAKADELEEENNDLKKIIEGIEELEDELSELKDINKEEKKELNEKIETLEKENK